MKSNLLNNFLVDISVVWPQIALLVLAATSTSVLGFTVLVWYAVLSLCGIIYLAQLTNKMIKNPPAKGKMSLAYKTYMVVTSLVEILILVSFSVYPAALLLFFGLILLFIFRF